MKYYLGIDGGGTKTTAAVGDEEGKILGKVHGKTINFYAVGIKQARENLKEITDEVCAIIGVSSFEGVFIGCSALDKKADEATVNELCGGIIEARKIEMDSDTYIALKSMGDACCPVVVICGTGSMVIGENEKGEAFISGGWGHILGDEGSGYSIAISVLKECAILADKGEETAVLKEACKFFNVESFRDVIPIIYSTETSKDIVAGFGAVVGSLAEKGDALSVKIIGEEAKKLYKTAEILIKKLEKTSKIGLYGGVFEKNQLFRTVFIEELRKNYPNIEASFLTVPPEESALRIGRNL